MTSITAAWRAFSERAERVERTWPIDRLSLPVYAIIFSLFTVDVTVIWATDFTILWDTRLTLFSLACWLAAIGLIARTYGHRRIATAFEVIAVPPIMGALTILLTVLLCRISEPMADTYLARADEIVGLDWLALVRFYDAHPTLATVSNASYKSYFYQFTFIPIILAVLGHRERMWRFLTAYGLGALIAALIFPFVPAVGPYIHYGVSQAHAPFPEAKWLWEFGARITAVRGGEIKNVMDGLGGLVTFPSFHTTAGILFIWATWDWWPARLYFVPLNVCLILSSVICGGHYFVDLIGGLIVAVAAICLTNAQQKISHWLPGDQTSVAASA